LTKKIQKELDLLKKQLASEDEINQDDCPFSGLELQDKKYQEEIKTSRLE
jgi:hypothetical protein